MPRRKKRTFLNRCPSCDDVTRCAGLCRSCQREQKKERIARAARVELDEDDDCLELEEDPISRSNRTYHGDGYDE